MVDNKLLMSETSAGGKQIHHCHPAAVNESHLISCSSPARDVFRIKYFSIVFFLPFVQIKSGAYVFLPSGSHPPRMTTPLRYILSAELCRFSSASTIPDLRNLQVHPLLPDQSAYLPASCCSLWKQKRADLLWSDRPTIRLSHFSSAIPDQISALFYCG